MSKIAWLICFFSVTLASGQNVFFNQITQEDGLVNSNVRALVRDYQGFLWIGTEDGLHRYDGTHMKVYRNAAGDSLTLSSNFILSLFEDSSNNLWVGTLDGGLNVYNRRTDTFTRCDLGEGSKTIRSFVEAPDGYLYIGSDRLVRTLVKGQSIGNFEIIPLGLQKEYTSGFRLASMSMLSDTTLLLSILTQGLYAYSLVTGQSRPFTATDKDSEFEAIYVDRRRSIIWGGTWRDGLVAYDPASGRERWFHTDQQILKSNFISTITGDRKGDVWIGTDKGLVQCSKTANPFEGDPLTVFLPEDKHHSGIKGVIVKAVHVDRSDKVWAGMYYEGVNVYDQSAMSFGSATIPALGPDVYTNVSAIETDRDGTAWIGLDGGGLYMTRGSWENIQKCKPCEPVDKVKALVSDHQGRLWIGTWGSGVYMLDERRAICRKVEFGDFSKTIGSEIISLAWDRQDKLLIGTFDNGLFSYEASTGRVIKLTTGDEHNYLDRINALLVDNGGKIWIGREAGGVGYIVPGSAEEHGIEAAHLTNATILSMYMDSDNVLWLGVMSKGLVRLDTRTGESTLFGESAGLRNGSVQSIVEDSFGRLWLSHHAGLSVLFKRDGSIINFDKTNGLLSNQSNRQASAVINDTTIAFGNIRGVNYFSPKKFVNTGNEVPLVFTRLLVNNAEQSPGSDVLTENISLTKTIRLNHDQNNVGIGFAALDFDFSQFRLFEYRLVGFEEAWQPLDGKQNLVTYTNLPPGEYFFELMLHSADEGASHVQRLHILVAPAWWQTRAFISGVVLVLLTTLYFLHRTRVNFLKRQRTELSRQVDERTLALDEANRSLMFQIEETQAINKLLHAKQAEIIEMNNEIQAQNEELQAQNEQITHQHESLARAKEQLQVINSTLEELVDERTEKLQSTIEDLNKTVFELDRFVYSASHDLSAPLKSILGLAEIINMEKDPTKIRMYTDHIKTSIKKLETVILSMVNFSRNTHELVTTETIDLRLLIDEVVMELAFAPEAMGMDFRNKLPSDFLIRSDRSRMKIVLHNLISNGIKYRDPRKEINWLQFEALVKDDQVVITVRDNGIGIRSEYQDKVFTMFFRGTELSKGSGLGLFLVTEAMHKLGGSIRVESVFGVETKFEVTLPYSEVQPVREAD